MAFDTPLDAVRDLIGLASTVRVLLGIVSRIQPQFERVRDSCRACEPPEGRSLLLWFVFILPIVWVAAAALYYHYLFSLWETMGAWLESQPVNRPVYALLHVYLFFLLLCGLYALAITIFEIIQLRKVFNDLLMIARFNTRKYQAVEDIEAQHSSSVPDLLDAETENHSAVGNNVAPAETCIYEPESPTAEVAWLGNDGPIGRSVTRTVHSPVRGSNVECSFGPVGGVKNNSEAIGSSDESRVTFDSDSDAMTVTPPSSSSSDASSGIDELEHVDHDYDHNTFQGVRLREPLQDSERGTRGSSSASCAMDQHGGVNGDDDPFNLHNATPCLRSQDQAASSFGEPLSPCGSCSSTHAESIPTAKRSPARVPITPTSPTAYAEDADTEWPDVVRKEQKNRKSAIFGPRIPLAETSRVLPRSDTNTARFGINPDLSDDEEAPKVLYFNPATRALERRAGTTATARPSGKTNSNHSPLSASILCNPDTSPPRDNGEREAELCLQSCRADHNGYTASRNDEASMVSFDGRFMFNPRFRLSGRVGPTRTKPLLKIRPGTPYPFVSGEEAGGAEGVRVPGPLPLGVPSAGLDSRSGE